MFNPIATYRLQFNKEFTFKDLEKIIPYLAKLGVSTIYASPIFKAVPGSNHGYDVTDPLQINPEIGTLAQFRRISKRLRKLGIAWLQDIVPNHMAFHPDNQWLWDVLEKGPQSAYAAYFDIIWEAGEKLMVPFLGDTLQNVIDSRELKITKKKGRRFFNYAGTLYPLKPGSYRKGESLLDIAARQNYELCDWKESNSRMNYRRFFTVNGLICLNMQDRKVFDHYHGLIRSLVAEGLIQGVRVDHVDGLFDPERYLLDLRGLLGQECYIVVEKILEEGENFPLDWPVQGNTGYDFLAQVNNLLTAREHKDSFTRFYQQLTGNNQPVQAAMPEKKAAILAQSMNGELENLFQLALSFVAVEPDPHLKEAIGEFLVLCPAYRYYRNRLPLASPDAIALRHLLAEVLSKKPHLKKAAVQLKRLFSSSLYFYQRCMQFTGPLMAKGVEDTLMYTYDRFIGHNEVGDSPDLFGIGTAAFHRQMIQRQQLSPFSLNATSTHDTKRGEDVRARLNVLTDIADEWTKLVPQWQAMNQDLKTAGAPDANDEYLIYQTLTGCYPFPAQSPDDLKSRLKSYLTKALREAKAHTGWADPDTGYEKATLDFAGKLLDQHRPFWESFQAWQESIADLSVINSLAQLILKFTCPGIPDVYQGCEGWDLSMVDPDNRRPVDFKIREKYISQSSLAELWDNRYSGRLKTWLTQKLFEFRKQYATLFASGEYIPLRVKGRQKDQVIAFARKETRQWAIIIVPLHLAKLNSDPLQIDWDNTAVVLPEQAPLQWVDYLSGKSILAGDQLQLTTVFEHIPFGILLSPQENNRRGAGIILPISSLPSPYPIGDMGPAARIFVDFLKESAQKYWQLLPINPVSAEFNYSPYSSFSSMAGNTLLISPDDLQKAGLLNAAEIVKYRTEPGRRVKYQLAESQKKKLLSLAWKRFDRKSPEFESFKQSEAYWLDDFALFLVLKEKFANKPWHRWPGPFKNRDKNSIRQFNKTNDELLQQVKGQQYLFIQQWSALKAYAAGQGIRLIGDLPFYISYDSADVWTHPEIFQLDKNKAMAGIAGVPPDYFNASGQLWNMPVYDWTSQAKTGFSWWHLRFRKNLQFFDLLRLDHFRAFYDYWKVPANEATAINGTWQSGPGRALFSTLMDKPGSFPFIAEDLGDISPGVYQLRDELGLPGMSVLQYAFGPDMPVSPHAPHNHKNHSICYSGTHDNNTAAGWYRQEATKTEKKNLAFYAGGKVTGDNIHEVLAELCYRSAAELAVLPIQDVLGLDEEARLNTPGESKANWLWRLKNKDINPKHRQMLLRLTKRYNRQ